MTVSDQAYSFKKRHPLPSSRGRFSVAAILGKSGGGNVDVSVGMNWDQDADLSERRTMPDPTQRPPRRPPKEPLIKIPESEIRVPPPEQLPPKPDESPEIRIPPGRIRQPPLVPPPAPEDRAA